VERELLPAEWAILGLLRIRPMHGYEMARRLERDGLPEVCPVEQSSLYTYLRTLEGRGLVAWDEARVGLRPPRKIYALTADGTALVDAWLRAPVGRMRDVRLVFLLKLYFLRQLDPEAEVLLLREQAAACEGYLRNLDAQSPAGAFTELVRASKRSAAEGTLAWIRRVLAEREAAFV
jgi:DNA-binding PadR family transcriptional regulator